MNRNKVFLLVLPAIGAAILAVLSQFSFAIGAVPITLQTFAIGLIATIFKSREAVSATLLYLLLGAIGLPVFAGGHGGFQSFLNPTAGYLLSAPLFAFITSILTHKNSSFLTILLANILGDTILFIGGIIGLNILGNLDFSKAIAVGVTPFILPDLLKILMLTIIKLQVLKSLGFHPYFADKQKN